MLPQALVITSVVLSASLLVTGDPDFYYTNLGEVVFSHVLFRHGERMPLDFYPNDPYKDASHWPFKLAQLTDEGKLQEYELGQWLRKRYSHMLSARYDVDEIYVLSTDLDRTLMSAQCCMAGLYGQQDSASIFQPVPIHTIPVEVDIILGAGATYPCPAYNAEVQRSKNLPEVQALYKKFEVMYEYVSNHTGNNVQDFSSAIRIYDALAIEERYNMTLPEWTHAVYPEPIKEAGLYSFVLPTWTTLLQRLKVGPLLKEMVEHYQAKRAGTLSPDRKLWVYSAHDATISALLNTFKVFDIHFPPYAACFILELRVLNDEYFVTLFYRNSTLGEPLLLPIKTCSAMCPLDQFVALVQPILPDNWVQECQLPLPTPNNHYWIIAITVAGVVGYTLLLILVVSCWNKKYSGNYFMSSSPFVNFKSKNISNYIYPQPK